MSSATGPGGLPRPGSQTLSPSTRLTIYTSIPGFVEVGNRGRCSGRCWGGCQIAVSREAEADTAPCGRRFQPIRDPQRFPVCPKCKELAAMLWGPE